MAYILEQLLYSRQNGHTPDKKFPLHSSNKELQLSIDLLKLCLVSSNLDLSMVDYYCIHKMGKFRLLTLRASYNHSTNVVLPKRYLLIDTNLHFCNLYCISNYENCQPFSENVSTSQSNCIFFVMNLLNLSRNMEAILFLTSIVLPIKHQFFRLFP